MAGKYLRWEPLKKFPLYYMALMYMSLFDTGLLSLLPWLDDSNPGGWSEGYPDNTLLKLTFVPLMFVNVVSGGESMHSLCTYRHGTLLPI